MLSILKCRNPNKDQTKRYKGTKEINILLSPYELQISEFTQLQKLLNPNYQSSKGVLVTYYIPLRFLLM